MGEIRKHYFLNQYVVFSSARKKRPHEFKNSLFSIKTPQESLPEHDEKCFFCPGNEPLTPKEKGHIGNPWRIRWFNNKFPIMQYSGQNKIKTDNNYFTYSSNFGIHEIIVNVREHNRDVSTMSEQELVELFLVYESRIDELLRKPGIEYVSVFKNYGSLAGASLVHDHSQVVAINFIPEQIKQELYHSFDINGECHYCKIIDIEKNSLRACYENSSAVAFTPYASVFPYELWIFPKRHVSRFKELNAEEMNDFVALLKKALQRLKTINASYNYYLVYSPEKVIKNNNTITLHFHLRLLPRFNIWAGFEFSTGIIVNPVLPEDAAKFYRNEE